MEEYKCSNCFHSAYKNKYRNTVPSLHTCMNENSENYLKDYAWSYSCNDWASVSDNYGPIAQWNKSTTLRTSD